MIFFQNIYTLFTTKNILKLEYEFDNNNDIDCYCNLCNFMTCYISPIIMFFMYKLKQY